MKKINWGIIGLGNIANIFGDGFSTVDNAIIKGIASLNKNKLKSFQKKFEIPDEFCFQNYNNLISSPDIDIIYIALPNNLHAKYINESIKQNKNVLVEKPAFTNFKDFKNTKNLINNKKIFFTEGFMYRYLPHIEKIKEIIQENNLGKLTYMNSIFNINAYKQKKLFGFKIMKPDYNNRLFNKNLGGGAILDVGCYPVSLSTLINSLTYNIKLDKISLENINSEYCESGVEIFSEAILNFDNKFKSKITCSFKETQNQKSIIEFQNGSLALDQSWLPNKKMNIKLKKGNELSEIKFKNEKNIYSYQIQYISNQILNNISKPSFPSMTMEEIEINTKILEKWMNS